ncbi:unnamed protein product [Aphanomyces euteiches]|uniref:Uncharacterized protein n=1 Tax=Aphanomyces euteiches TaxID=100861 RepID=A0A6G0WRB5_9STRA|nr:hypothetical protein Ae201684_012486 [Aphanomyces euteiches]KAH9087617.1 hypothetical protein LEN26_019932 [Aphanomyces euteiches]KAH9090619.1 hypothetical protein Ae201684P_014415 [Aphanomyces euteiches]KAH9111783.1 hypothetical protein AeMF1_013776 [Aphanomyces euteiches]KAH9139388.1 hypothetical protein AeRB84_016336 [Aphanomyces euteiches]
MRPQLVLCAYLSVAGVVFLSLLGLILYLQPDYVHGLDATIPKHRLAINCWLGAALYAGTWIVSIISLCIHARHEAFKKKTANKLLEMQRSLTSWEDLGMPARIEDEETDIDEL